MEVPAVVVLVLLALLLGAAFGAWCAWPLPPSLEAPTPAPGPAPGPAPAQPASSFAPPPASPLSGLRERFLPAGQVVAAALEAAPLEAEAHAELLATLAAEHWQLGVTELRQALVTSSGLSPALVDHMASLAILSLEARHAPEAQPRR